MTKEEQFNFTWGLPELEAMGYIQIYGFMLKAYSELGVSRTEFLTLVHLASYHYNSPTGESRPSLDTLAAEMGYNSPGSVARVITSLEEKGMLTVTRRPGKTSTYDASPFAAAALALNGVSVTPRNFATPSNSARTTPRKIARTPRAELRDEEEERIQIKEEKEVAHGPNGRNETETSKGGRSSTETTELPKRVVQATGDPMADRVALGDAGANAILSTEKVAMALQGAVLGPGARWPTGKAKSAANARAGYLAVTEQILQTVGWDKWEEVIATIDWMDSHVTFGSKDNTPKELDAAWLGRASSPGAWKAHVIKHTLRRLNSGPISGDWNERLVFDE